MADNENPTQPAHRNPPYALEQLIIVFRGKQITSSVNCSSCLRAVSVIEGISTICSKNNTRHFLFDSMDRFYIHTVRYKYFHKIKVKRRSKSERQGPLFFKKLSKGVHLVTLILGFFFFFKDDIIMSFSLVWVIHQPRYIDIQCMRMFREPPKGGAIGPL